MILRKIGETVARTVYRNQAQPELDCGRIEDPRFEPRGGKAVTVKDRFTVRDPVLAESEHAPIAKLDAGHCRRRFDTIPERS